MNNVIKDNKDRITEYDEFIEGKLRKVQINYFENGFKQITSYYYHRDNSLLLGIGDLIKNENLMFITIYDKNNRPIRTTALTRNREMAETKYFCYNAKSTETFEIKYIVPNYPSDCYNGVDISNAQYERRNLKNQILEEIWFVYESRIMNENFNYKKYLSKKIKKTDNKIANQIALSLNRVFLEQEIFSSLEKKINKKITSIIVNEKIKIEIDESFFYTDEESENIDNILEECYREQRFNSNSDSDRDTFYALTDGSLGNYDDWKESGGDIDNLMTSLGY